MLVQRGTTTLTGVLETVVTLDTPVPEGHSWVQVSRNSPDTIDGAHYATCVLDTIVDGNYTELRITRGYTNDSTTVHWQVISDKMFTVQHGVTTIANTASVDVTIDAVDLSKTFAVVTYTGTVSYIRYLGTRASLPATTTLRLIRGVSISTAITVSWFVVTMTGASVQAGTVTMPDTSITATINQIDPLKTFMVFDRACDTGTGDGRYSKEHTTRGYFDNNTTVKFERFDDEYSGSVYVDYFIVSHPGISVSSSTGTFTGTSTTKTIATDQRFTLGFVSSYAEHTSQNKYSEYAVGIDITDGTTLTLTRTAELTTAHYSYFVVEFPAVQPPVSLSPDGVAIVPTDSNTFTFTLPDATAPEYQELQYREVGAASWISAVKEAYSGGHIFAVNTFVIGKDYEWQARYWETGETDPSDWSETATFDTYNPVISNPMPVPSSSIRVDIRDFGGRLKSPYGRDIQLTIEIADNAAYTSATTYTLPVVESGTEAIMQHAIQEGGTWYVRMTATDTESLQTVLEYSFFAGQFIQFITHPDIDIEAQSATHVTVRVKDTATEYTAVIDPAPTADKVIERLFYISTGTQANCQAVAEAFLAKLGRRQLTVSGVIPLTVTLKIGQYVKVVIPTAKINQDMILQRKQHRINEGEAVTHVTLGDIKVSDQEMIARIVERLESQGV